MIGASLPAECDLPGMSCSTAGGTWWPVIVAAVLLAGWIGYRFGRFGGRCPICFARRGQPCAAGCYNDWPTGSGE